MPKKTFYCDNEPERQRMYAATDCDCLVTVEPLKTMTQKQRGSLHVWFEMVAEALYNAGLHCVRKSFWDNSEIEIDWNLMLVKEHIYKHVLNAMTGKASTEDQDTAEPSVIVNHIVRHFGARGIVLPEWPSLRC